MLRVKNVCDSGKMLKLQHQFSSKKHKIYKSYDVETQQTYLTKIIIVKDDYMALYYQHHLLSNVMNYLTMSNNRDSTMLNIVPYDSSVMIKDMQADKSKQQLGNSQKISKVIYMSKKFIPGFTLRQMVQAQDNRLNSKFSISLIGNILDFIFKCGGVNDLIISSQNIIVGQDNSFHLNYFSTVGLDLLKFDKYIPRIDFQQIFPYLTLNYIHNCKKTHQYDIEIHLKFIVINFITAFFRKDLLFQIQFEHQVKKASINSQMIELQKKILPGLITTSQLLSIKNSYDQSYGEQLIQLIKCTLQRSLELEQTKNKKDQTKTQKKYDWPWILSLLCRNKQREGSQVAVKYPRDQNFNSFACSIIQLLNHYINIINYLFTNNLEQQTYKITDIKEVKTQILKKTKVNLQNQLRDKDIKRLTDKANSLFLERKALYQRGWYIKQLFIPIKTGMSFTRIIKFPNWICMLAQQTKVNIDNITAVLNLLEFILQIQEDMKLLDNSQCSLITQSVILNTLQINRICEQKQVQYKFKSQKQYSSQNQLRFSTYRQIILQEQTSNSKMDNANSNIQTNLSPKNKKPIQDKEIQSEGQDQQLNSQIDKQLDKQHEQHKSQLIQRFWRQFRENLSKLKIFIQKYYLTVSQKKVRNDIKINCQPQSKLIHKLARYFTNTKQLKKLGKNKNE